MQVQLNLVFQGTGVVVLSDLALTQENPDAPATNPVVSAPAGPVSTDSQIMAAAARDPDIWPLVNHMNYLRARLASLQMQYGQAHPLIAAARQSLQTSAAELDRRVAISQAISAAAPPWLRWMDQHIPAQRAAWSCGIFMMLAVLAERLTCQGSAWGKVLAGLAVVCGLALFGWGMAAAGRGDSVMSVGPLVCNGLSLIVLTLVILPGVGRQRQAAELRRMAAMDVG